MTKIVLKDVRLSTFNDSLWVPDSYEGKGTPKFSGTLLIVKDSEQDKLIRSTIAQVAKEAWADKWKAKIEEFKGDRTRYCYRDGDAKELDGYQGHMYLTGKNKSRPLIINRDKSPLTQADGKPYSGCYVVSQVDIWAQTKAPNTGMRCTLLGVQFYRDGDAFTGGAPASLDDFDDLGNGADASPDFGDDEGLA